MTRLQRGESSLVSLITDSMRTWGKDLDEKRALLEARARRSTSEMRLKELSPESGYLRLGLMHSEGLLWAGDKVRSGLHCSMDASSEE